METLPAGSRGSAEHPLRTGIQAPSLCACPPLSAQACEGGE